MSEKIPMSHEQPGWQDITITSLHTMIGEGRLRDALRSAQIRLEAITEVQNDIVDALGNAHNESLISIADWKKEKAYLEEEVEELQKIIQTLEHELDAQ